MISVPTEKGKTMNELNQLIGFIAALVFAFGFGVVCGALLFGR